jgi:acetyl-CoA synthetase
MLYAAYTHEAVFDYARTISTGAPPMSAGSPATATSLRAAGQRRDHADVRRRAELPGHLALLERHRQAQGVIFYTAPTAIRALMREGEEPVKARASLRLLGSVGEPINPEAWEWYYTRWSAKPLPDRRHLVADRNRRHPDHALPGATDLKPGSATRPSSACSRRWSTTMARSWTARPRAPDHP